MAKAKKRNHTSHRNRKRGKDAERAISKLFGGTRVGTLGYEDVRHHMFSIEVKSRERFGPAKWYEQAVANNPDKGARVPIVVVHRKNYAHKEDFVMLNIMDFLSIIKEMEALADDCEEEEGKD